jgi:LPXTG-motif cell wall-anchored protein
MGHHLSHHFAMHHIQAVRLIDSLAVDLLLTMGVVAAMVWHTLKYESQLVTGLCFFLGFFTIAQSHTSAWSLLAGVMLAAGLAVIVLKRKW